MHFCGINYKSAPMRQCAPMPLFNIGTLAHWRILGAPTVRQYVQGVWGKERAH